MVQVSNAAAGNRVKINADLTRPASVDSRALPWVPSPLPGVERRMLERDGAEVARATSLVRYAPGSVFSRHEHALGEEILVIDGVFRDETGEFGAGMYVRNPPGSGHAPSSPRGCSLLVKLRQMHPQDDAVVRVDTRRDDAGWEAGRPGERVLRLYAGWGEEVCLLRWTAATALPAQHFAAGVEYFVLQGGFEDESGAHGAGAWLRLPAGSLQRVCVSEATEVYRKTGHLSPGPRPAT